MHVLTRMCNTMTGLSNPNIVQHKVLLLATIRSAVKYWCNWPQSHWCVKNSLCSVVPCSGQLANACLKLVRVLLCNLYWRPMYPTKSLKPAKACVQPKVGNAAFLACGEELKGFVMVYMKTSLETSASVLCAVCGLCSWVSKAATVFSVDS